MRLSLLLSLCHPSFCLTFLISNSFSPTSSYLYFPNSLILPPTLLFFLSLSRSHTKHLPVYFASSAIVSQSFKHIFTTTQCLFQFLPDFDTTIFFPQLSPSAPCLSIYSFPTLSPATTLQSVISFQLHLLQNIAHLCSAFFLRSFTLLFFFTFSIKYIQHSHFHAFLQNPLSSCPFAFLSWTTYLSSLFINPLIYSSFRIIPSPFHFSSPP